MSAAPARAYLDAAAAYGMALRYHHPPQGGKRNYKRTLLLYYRADSDDHASAAFAIGLMYAADSGVKRSDAHAAAWFHRAAAIGHGEAQTLLQIFKGRGRPGPAQCPNGWGRGASIGERLRSPANLKQLIEEMAPRYRLDPKLVLAVVSGESAFQPDAVSSKKAQGLMQPIPATATRFGVRDPFNPADNLRGGMAYLRWPLTRFKGRVRLALAAYNAGEGAIKRYGGVPTYMETRNYLKKIRDLYSTTSHPF